MTELADELRDVLVAAGLETERWTKSWKERRGLRRVDVYVSEHVSVVLPSGERASLNVMADLRPRLPRRP